MLKQYVRKPVIYAENIQQELLVKFFLLLNSRVYVLHLWYRLRIKNVASFFLV